MKTNSIKTTLFLCATLFSLSSLYGDDTQPKQWGENVSGVATKFHTSKKEIALTFDACGGSPFSKGYDKELIDFLTLHKIPATLFLNGGWIEANLDIFKELQKNPLFEIANHGMKHRPLSINGKSIYGRNGTRSKQEVLEEVEGNNKLLQSLNQKRPLFFRSGTAYYDEIAVDIVKNELQMEIAGFSINSDAGATYSKTSIISELISARNGDIVIAHMNHPEGFTAEGYMEGLKILQEKGFSFVKLSDIKNHLIKIP